MLNLIIASLLASYLIGSLNFAIIIAKLGKLTDPRQKGSLNPGATNMLRLHGKKVAFVTLVGDLLKGSLVLVAFKHYNFSDLVIALSGVAVFLGHLYPLFFKFRGGKGVATFFGLLLVLNYRLALMCFLLWLIIYKTSKLSSLAAIVVAIAAPVLAYYKLPTVYFLLVLTTAIFMLLRHRENIRRILDKKELSFTAK